MPKPTCPHCGASTSVVERTQWLAIANSDGYRRRRRCAECGKTWPTIETLDVDRFERELAHPTPRLTGSARPRDRFGRFIRSGT